MKRFFSSILLLGLLLSINSGKAEWIMRRPMQYPRYGAMVAVASNKIYVIGGMINQNTAVAHVEEYNPMLDTWITKAPMPTPRGLGVCGVVNNKIYVVGGVIGRNMPIETVEVYDPLLNQWQRKNRMPTQRTGYNGGVIEDSIYVCGGFFPNMRPYTDTVEVYCVSQDSWFTRRSMEQARVDFGAVALNNRLYAISGVFFNYVNQTEEYSPINDTWRMKTPIPFARIGISCAALNNKIYSIGGERRGPRVVYGRIDVYNLSNNSWTQIDSINVPRAYAGAVAIENHIYVIGGLMRNDMPTPVVEQYSTTSIEEIETQIVYAPQLTIFPNPFKFVTRLGFDNSYNQYGSSQVKIYDNSGKLIKTIPCLRKTSYITWDGTDELKARVKAGVYFANITNQSNQNTAFVKIVVLR